MSFEEEKKLDDFTHKIVSAAGLESPSANFLDGVLSRIRKEQRFVYKPLIKRNVLIGIAACLIALIALAYNFVDDSFLRGLSDKYDLKLNELDLSIGFAIPNTLMTILIIAFTLILIQLFIVKRLYFKQLK